MKLSWKTTHGVKHGAWAVALFVGLLGLVVLCSSDAYAQAEIDPDHFGSPNAQPVSQPSTDDSQVTVTRYDRAFSLAYRVSCNGKQLALGKYSSELRSDGGVGQATPRRNGYRFGRCLHVRGT